MDRNGVTQSGSRIPRFSGAGGTMAATNYRTEPLPGIGQKPSRLEMMQKELQKNIMKEKEEKIINMYEANQQRALEKVNQNRSHVREFFEQRRAMGPSDNLSPTIEQLYQQKKSESQMSGFSHSGGKVNARYGTNTRVSPVKQQKLSAGRDRSNLLAPIQKNGGQNADGNPFAKKPQIVRPKTYTGKGMVPQNKENVHVSHFSPKSAPAGDNYYQIQNNLEDETPPPNPQQLAHLQQKRKMLQQQQQGNKNVGPPKHLRKNQTHSRNQVEYEPSDEEDDEGFDDNSTNSGDEELKRKQQELLAQIEAQQRELDRLRNERTHAELEEQKEAERRQKFEEEKRKRQADEMARRRREEQEEQMREQFEEEKQLKLEEEKQRMKKTTGPTSSRMMNKSVNEARNHNGYSGRDDFEEKTPTPPPQPQPANTRKSVPQKRAPPQKNSPSPPPLPKSDVSLYENAIAQEGAFENVGHLKACYNCGRSFAVDRLAKHEQACKIATKKRKVMDPSKLRTRGTEMEQYVSSASKQRAPEKSKKSSWRTQHKSFMEAIRYAKKCSQIEKDGGKLSDLPPPPVSENPDYVQCPYCTRKFNETAAERHIPHCKNTRAKPPPQRK